MKKTALILAILLLASVLRIWHLGGIPISANWDESALGYNAYSILHTGKDEYGVFLPSVLRSFNDYKPAGSVYLIAPSVAIFGLNVFAVRLPFAISGILSVLGTYFLTKKLLSFSKIEKKSGERIAITSSFLLAISPWHIQFSRYGHEGGIVLALFIFGFYFLLRGLEKPVWYILSATLFGISINIYHTPRLFIPLTLLGFLVIFRKKIMTDWKKLIFPALVGFVFVLPILFSFANNSESITERFSQTNVFAGRTTVEAVYSIGAGYASHFSPSWLFITGDNDRHHAPSTGLLYLWEFPFLMAGFIYLLKSKGDFKKIMLLLIFLVPTPAALTTEVPHAGRTLYFLPLLQILTSLGIFLLIKATWKSALKKRVAIYAPILLVSLFFILQYFHLYYYQMNHEFSRVWQFGYSDAVSFVLQNPKYEKVIVSDKLEQPYIFFLFYLKYNPKTYLAEGGTNRGHNKSFGKYAFRYVDFEKEIHDGKHLYILNPIEKVDHKIHTIRNFDNTEAFIFSE